jgi:hypothetical protein
MSVAVYSFICDDIKHEYSLLSFCKMQADPNWVPSQHKICASYRFMKYNMGVIVGMT